MYEGITAEVMAIGTELLSGAVENTNSRKISQGLSTLGFPVSYHSVVGDCLPELEQALRQARGRSNWIVTTGGLGPTWDDLSKEAAAQVFGLELVYDPQSLEEIEAYCRRTGQSVTEPHRRQALVPRGATVFPNDWGAAPGFAFVQDGIHVVMLPGPPKECEPLFVQKVMPYLKGWSKGAIVSKTVKLFGLGEAKIEEYLASEMKGMTNPVLAPYAKEGECELCVTARGETREEAEGLLHPVLEQVQQKLGHWIYGVDVPSLEWVVKDLLTKRGERLSTAESCTGGWIAKRITDLPGSSQIFGGGVVSYTNEGKQRLLGVSPGLLQQHGAVSGPVARAMAQGIRQALGCELGLASTGVAGPDSDDRGNPIGLVFLALATEQEVYVREIRTGSQERDSIRRLAAHHGLDLVRRYAMGLPMEVPDLSTSEERGGTD